MRGKQESKRLTATMVKGIVLLGLLSLFVVMLVMVGIYRPMLQQQTLEAAVSTGQILAAQIDVAVQSVVGYSDFYVDSAELRNALEGYEQTPGETTETAVCQVLTQMQPAGIANIHNALVLRDGLFLTASSPLTQADKNMLNADWTFHIKDGTVQQLKGES